MSQDIFWVFYVQVWWKISKGSDPNCQWQIPVHYIIRWLCVNLNHLSPTNSRLPLLYSTIPRPPPHLKSPNLSLYPPPTSTWHVGSTMCANFYILMNYALNLYLVIFGLHMLIHQNPRLADSTHPAWAQIIFSGPQKIIDVVFSPTLDTLYDYLPFCFFFNKY